MQAREKEGLLVNFYIYSSIKHANILKQNAGVQFSRPETDKNGPTERPLFNIKSQYTITSSITSE